jgi:hypothetical protein
VAFGARFCFLRLDDDIRYTMAKAGDDFLITATDFPHGDAFRHDQLAQGLMRRGDLSETTIEKILSENPQRLYPFGKFYRVTGPNLTLKCLRAENE